MLETLINYPRDVINSRLLAEMFIPDTPAEMDNPDPVGANAGLVAREAHFVGSRTVRLVGRLHSDLWHQEKLLPPQLKLDIQLVPNRAAFVVKSAVPGRDQPQVQYKIHIISARFLIQMKEISAPMFLAHQKMLETVNSSKRTTSSGPKTLHVQNPTLEFENFLISRIFSKESPLSTFLLIFDFWNLNNYYF